MHQRIDPHSIRHKCHILAFLALFVLAGCNHATPLYIDTHVDGPKLYAVDPAPVQMNDIEWIIISKANIDQYLPDIQSGKLTVIGLTVNDYEDLSINTLRLLNYIESQQSVIASYRKFYESE